MNSRSSQFVGIVLIVATLAGCQSGPRWAQVPSRMAWWKKGTASDDNSLVARSAAPEVESPAVPPVLPSTKATPQSLTAALAMPPSAKSVAVAVAAPPVTPYSATPSPATPFPASSAATIAAAPTATYPTAAYSTPAYPTTMAAAPPMATPVGPASPPTTIAPTTMTQAGPVAQSGPYDPNAYKAVAATAAPTDLTAESAPDDRYGESTSQPGSYPGSYMTPSAPAPATQIASTPTATAPSASAPPVSATSPAAESNDRYAYNTPAVSPASSPSVPSPSAAVAGDRYAQASPVNPMSAPTTAPATVPSTTPAAGDTQIVQPPVAPAAIAPIGPQSSTMPANAGTVAAATVHIASPPGQYRPGGTSSFTGLSTMPTQIASRPTTVTPSPVTPPTPSTSGLPDYPSGGNSPLQRY